MVSNTRQAVAHDRPATPPRRGGTRFALAWALLAWMALPAQAQTGVQIVSGNGQTLSVGGTSLALVTHSTVVIGAPSPAAVAGGVGLLYLIIADGSGGAAILRDSANPRCFSSIFPGYCEVDYGVPASTASAFLRAGPVPGGAIQVRVCPAERVFTGTIWSGVRCIPGGFNFTATFNATVRIAPVLSVTAESNVTTSGATLNGTLLPNDNPVATAFDYRVLPSGAFQSVASQSVSGGRTTIPVSATVALNCGSSYEYRLRGSVNGNSFTSPSTRSFSTPACPVLAPQLGALLVSNIGQTSARLDAGIVTNNALTTVGFEYRLTVAATWTNAGSVVLPAATQATVASLALANLACGRDYQYRVTAQNAGGTTGPSAPADFATTACASSNLQATLAVGGTPRAGSRVTLNASVTGGSGALRYEWDVDGDGAIDRAGPQATLDVIHATAFDGNASVTVTDANGTQGFRAVPLSIGAPRLEASAIGAASQVCGDGDALPEPGERWQLPLRVTNEGTQASTGGYVNLAPGDRRQAAAGGEFVAGVVALDPPALPVGTLAAGAAVERLLAIQLSRSAACGTSYAIQQDLGVDDTSYGGSAGRVLATLATPPAAQCQVYSGCVAPKATVVPRQGLYFDGDRGGNGISNLLVQTPQGTVFFGAWFTGSSDRKPTWNIVQGLLVDNQVVAPVYRYSKRQGSAFAVDRRTVGTATITLLESERFLFSWSIGTRSGAESMQYLVPGAGVTPNRTGAWYAPAESGWGQVLSQFPGDGGASTTFVVHYLYDAVGEPRWVLAVEPTASLVNGRPHLTFPVHCPGCPWLPDWNDQRLEAGTGSLVFDGARNARVTTSFALPSAFGGTWQRTALPVELITDPQ